MEWKQKVMKQKQKVAKTTKSDKTEQKVMKWNKKQRNRHRYMATKTKSNETEQKVAKQMLRYVDFNKK